MKGTLNCCKLQVIFKSERKLSNMFRFKDRVPYDLVSGVVYEYMHCRYNSFYYGETERHLRVRPGEHMGISLLAFKNTKRSKQSLKRDHLLQCDTNPSFDKFTNKKNFLEIKERLLIKRNQPVLTKNSFTKLHFIWQDLMSLVSFYCGNCNFMIGHCVGFIEKLSPL